ncbi:MAG TPA: FAD-dependent oxidoreductase [Baekduia sp.]|uniref:FAD-dependent oxidoreductase n=1 Tax=Baekduia sp. TaxID=2600305 RepID=UPI002CA95B83|nr:FAD-dependent oxidoreductase [Baekduia sp.]HMJ34443.1 FAD-dependent oxidoreductase [Baekduia sp.]
MTTENSQRPSVVVVGGGYAGVNVAKALDDVADVTLVDPKNAFVHNVAAWRALVEPEWLDRIFFPYDRLLAHGTFLRDRAVAVDGRHVTLASGRELAADYVVLASGSSYPFPAKSDEPDTETARARYRDAHEALLAAGRVLLIGAGPSGLELAGEIKAFFPDKHVTVADVSPDILAGPYDQTLRDELRRQLDELGVELQLGSPLTALPAAAPATLAPVAITTEAGDELTADVWYRAFGVTPHTEYLRGALSDARDDRGYVRVDEHLRVIGQDGVFAVGDIADADRDMAGIAGMQAKAVTGTIRNLITGEGEPVAWAAFPPFIAVPLGPEGGAGLLPGHDGVAGAAVIAEVKGRDMMVDNFAGLFDAEPATTR